MKKINRANKIWRCRNYDSTIPHLHKALICLEVQMSALCIVRAQKRNPYQFPDISSIFFFNAYLYFKWKLKYGENIFFSIYNLYLKY